MHDGSQLEEKKERAVEGKENREKVRQKERNHGVAFKVCVVGEREEEKEGGKCRLIQGETAAPSGTGGRGNAGPKAATWRVAGLVGKVPFYLGCLEVYQKKKIPRCLENNIKHYHC